MNTAGEDLVGLVIVTFPFFLGGSSSSYSSSPLGSSSPSLLLSNFPFLLLVEEGARLLVAFQSFLHFLSSSLQGLRKLDF